MSGTENLFQRFLSILGGKAFSTLLALVSTPIVARLLGPGGYGDYAALLSIFSLYMIPVSAGITEGIQKFVAESRDTPNWQTHVVRSGQSAPATLPIMSMDDHRSTDAGWSDEY